VLREGEIELEREERGEDRGKRLMGKYLQEAHVKAKQHM